MKILSLVLVGVLMFGGLAIASDVLSDPPSGSTEGTNWQTPSSGINSFLNEYANHEHGIPARENPLGLGLDIDYIISDTYSAGVEYRYDTRNEEHATYLVGKIVLGNK